ncbi:MAG: hypothetical protein J0G30_08490 [Actinomycetales bacterium]|nr:hypothetical protein [Actinomycetales bacterium]
MATVASLAVLAVALVVVAPWDAQRRQAIADQITVWTHPPTADIETIADEVTLTPDARRIFFATRPSIEPADSFNGHCEVEGQTVLGCYTSDDRIYVYQVTDERLAGTVEVTAAHEFLHAAYERLSAGERDRVDALVAAAVDAIPPDDPVRAVMATYPASQLADEWHSRLGTEFADLGPELEQYYARYFDDRSAVLAFDRQSTAALDDLQAQIDDLVTQLDALGADLDRRSTAYESDVAALNADIDDFNARAQTPGAFSSQAEFDRERAALQARYDALENDRLALNADTDRYNAMVDQLESLDASYADLYSNLDSTQAPDQVGG